MTVTTEYRQRLDGCALIYNLRTLNLFIRSVNCTVQTIAALEMKLHDVDEQLFGLASCGTLASYAWLNGA